MCHTCKGFTRNEVFDQKILSSCWTNSAKLLYQGISVIYIPSSGIKGFSYHFFSSLLFFTHFLKKIQVFIFYLLQRDILFSLCDNSNIWSPWLAKSEVVQFSVKGNIINILGCGL